MSHTCGNVLLHMIFSTHQRRPFIQPEIRSELFAYLGGIVREMNGTALIINGAKNHVRMLVRVRPIPIGCGNRSGGESEFIALDSWANS